MTERVYLIDPYQTQLEARVLACEKAGDGYAAILDKTICYPRGGGQPCEPATLGGQPVLDCYEQDGQLLHIVAAPVAAGPVAVAIDGPARLDHMRQHLGEHILSRVIENLFGGKISILRIEAESSHIEIDRPLSHGQLLEAQEAANAVIAQNLPVRSILAAPAEAEAKYGVPAAKAAAHETVRIVEIEGFDYNGCGGTHCRTTGEVGRLLICGAKPVRGQFRIYFQCGPRAEAEDRARTLALLGLQEAFDLELLPQLLPRAQATLGRKAELEAENQALRARVLDLDTQLLAARAEAVGGRLFAAAILEEGDAKHIKAVCDGLVAGHDALLLCAVRAGEGLSLIFARSRSKSPEPNLGTLLRQLATAHGGKGGGSAILAQGMMEDTPDSRAAFEALAGQVREGMACAPSE